MHLLILTIVVVVLLMFLAVHLGIWFRQDVALHAASAEISQWGDEMLIWRDSVKAFRPVLYSDVTTAPHRQSRRTSSPPVM
jgi:hypothetical protein